MQKTAYIILVALMTSLTAVAQKNKEIQWPDMPRDNDSELITYTDVIKVDGVNADALYDRAMKWINDHYKNPAEKLRKQDKENGEIELFIRYRIYNKDKKGNQASSAGLVQYTLKLMFKNGRYKYTFTDFNLQQTSYFAIEQWFDETADTADKHADYLTQVHEEIGREKEALVTGLADDGKKAEDDW